MIIEFQLLDHICHPAFSEALPGEHVHGPGAKQGPQRHLHGAGVRRRHDADAVILGHPKEHTGLVDGLLELGLAELGSVGAAQGRV